MDFKTYKRMGLQWTMKHFRWYIVRTVRVLTSPKLWAARLYAIRKWRPGSKVSFQEYEDLSTACGRYETIQGIIRVE